MKKTEGSEDSQRSTIIVRRRDLEKKREILYEVCWLLRHKLSLTVQVRRTDGIK